MTKKILFLIVVLVMTGCGWRETNKNIQLSVCVRSVIAELNISLAPEDYETIALLCEKAGAGK